jgi:exodeoxyribonuclease VII small subunit
MATPAQPSAPRRRGPAATAATPEAARTAGADPSVAEAPAIDTVLGELERVVAELEAGDLPLEIALRRFEDGVRLARQGGQLLDAVEQRVEMLLEGREGSVPFPGADTQDDDSEDDDDDL